jgi:hypothetical protein
VYKTAPINIINHQKLIENIKLAIEAYRDKVIQVLAPILVSKLAIDETMNVICELNVAT